MVKIAICEDEKIFSDHLVKEIKKYFSNQREGAEIEVYASGASLKDTHYEAYDLIFLDVDLKEVEDGITLAKNLREQGYGGFIIFLTSHQEEAYKAFEVEAFRYLLKPIDEEALRNALQDVLVQVKKRQAQTLCLKSGQSLLQLKTEEIVCLETFERKVQVHTMQETYLVNEKIKDLEARIKDPCFFKIHKAFLINFRHVKEHIDTSITMMNGQVLYISRLKLAPFKKAFMAYLLEE
jgi:DNA-binding LytR/AlgR family response regulator